MFKNDNPFVDVTLVSDELIPHKVNKHVLGACSPVFKDILLKNYHQHPLIYLTGVENEARASAFSKASVFRQCYTV